MSVGPGDDPAEREADQVAARIVAELGRSGGEARAGAAPAAKIQRRADASVAADGGEVGPEIEGAIDRSHGEPMAAEDRSRFEAAFGADFSEVRVHTESKIAPRIGAEAFARGDDIHFASGRYRPETPEGQNLIGHELAHVVQQSQDNVVQRRSTNPNNLETGTTSHHIIPHELLGKILKNLDAPDRADVLRSSIPDFADVTLANVVAQGAIRLTYDGEVVKAIAALPDEVRNVPFKDLGAGPKAKSSFAIETEGESATVDFTRFGEWWASIKLGETIEHDQGGGEMVEVTGFRDVGESFYEWQAGNLFYGPDRIEPGKKDGFDFDGRFIYGEAHMKDLAEVYTELRALEKKTDPVSKARMKELLLRMNARAVGVVVPPNDPTSGIQSPRETRKRFSISCCPVARTQARSAPRYTRMCSRAPARGTPKTPPTPCSDMSAHMLSTTHQPAPIAHLKSSRRRRDPSI